MPKDDALDCENQKRMGIQYSRQCSYHPSNENRIGFSISIRIKLDDLPRNRCINRGGSNFPLPNETLLTYKNEQYRRRLKFS